MKKLFRLMISFCKGVLGGRREMFTKNASDGISGQGGYGCECTVVESSGMDVLDRLSCRTDLVMRKKELYRNPGITLESLAQELGTNRTYLSRMFNRKKEMSFLCYLNGLRLNYAYGMVKNGVYDRKRIMEESGFPSARAFYKSLMYADVRCFSLDKKKVSLYKFEYRYGRRKDYFFNEWRGQDFACQ